jgi:hypothetical protein
VTRQPPQRQKKQDREIVMSVAIAAQPEPSTSVASFLRRPGRLLIGGEWVESKSDVRIPVTDPATGREIATVADANGADVDRGRQPVVRGCSGGSPIS